MSTGEKLPHTRTALPAIQPCSLDQRSASAAQAFCMIVVMCANTVAGIVTTEAFDHAERFSLQ
jgi:hypothetical protein